MDVASIIKELTDEAEQGELIFPTSSAIALRAYQGLINPECTLNEATQLIQLEPLLSTRIVAVSNSATYGRPGMQITDLRTALARIGFLTARALALSVFVRQLTVGLEQPAEQHFATQLWEHSANVAALAQVIASRVTKQDPETAMFAGMVHEIGGFYLLSRSKDFPALMSNLTAELENDEDEPSPESTIGRCVLTTLEVPETVLSCIEDLWAGFLAFPPTTLGDTLLLADRLSPAQSPMFQPSEADKNNAAVTIDMAVGKNTLTNILAESKNELESLTGALRM